MQILLAFLMTAFWICGYGNFILALSHYSMKCVHNHYTMAIVFITAAIVIPIVNDLIDFANDKRGGN